jgi:hypothetical protein
VRDGNDDDEGEDGSRTCPNNGRGRDEEKPIATKTRFGDG